MHHPSAINDYYIYIYPYVTTKQFVQFQYFTISLTQNLQINYFTKHLF